MQSKRVLACVLVVAHLAAGCAHQTASGRRNAKLIEGAAIVAGIALLSFAKTGADCQGGPGGRTSLDDCRTQATLVGNGGLALILGGLAGFTYTTVTTPEDPAVVPPQPATAKTVARKVAPAN